MMLRDMIESTRQFVLETARVVACVVLCFAGFASIGRTVFFDGDFSWFVGGVLLVSVAFWRFPWTTSLD